MTNHTEGLLAVRHEWIIPAEHIDRKIGMSTDKERDFTDYAHIVATVPTHRNYHDNAANARRLVACWNACDGSDVEDLERLGADYIKPLIDLIDHKEAARTLLSDALEAFDDNPSQDHEVADRIRAFLKVEA